MRDELNRYASPSVAGATGSSSLRAPRRPWNTRVINLGLMMNLASLPVFVVLETTEDALRRYGDIDGLANAIGSVCEAIGA